MSVFPSSFNKRITAGGEIPQEVLVAVWSARKECQRATNSDTETKHQSQCASYDWTRSENSDGEREMKQIQQHQESLEEEGRKTL